MLRGSVKRKQEIVGRRISFKPLFSLEKQLGNTINPIVEKTERRKPISYMINGFITIIEVQHNRRE